MALAPIGNPGSAQPLPARETPASTQSAVPLRDSERPIRIDPPEGASRAFEIYLILICKAFQDLLNTLGDRHFAVEPPDAEQSPGRPSDHPVGFSGATQASYSDFDDVLRKHSSGWDGPQRDAVALAQKAATVGDRARDHVMSMVETVRSSFATIELHARQAGFHTFRPYVEETDTYLASYAEVLALQSAYACLDSAAAAVFEAQESLGLDEDLPVLPPIPYVDPDVPPPPDYRMRRRNPQPELDAKQV